MRPSEERTDKDLEEGAWEGASTIVFQEPQEGQRPIHFGLSAPQELQNHDVFALPAIMLGALKFKNFHILDPALLQLEA